MWPLVRVLELGLIGDYDAVLKLHTKTSVHRIDGDAWRDRLLDSLCPSPEGIALILELLRRDPDVGMVAPEARVLGREFWGANGPMVDALAARTGIGVDPERVWFPGGSMFWSRPSPLNRLRDAGLTIEDFEHEAVSIDGTTAHALERFVGALVADAGMSSSGPTRWPVGWRRHEHEAIQETPMQVEPLPIEGAWVFTPRIHGDERGAFLEWFKDPVFIEAVGHRLDLAQANASVSAKGVLRGIHFADVPPGQAKYVTCVKGSVLDVIVDIRVGSPTFGQWTSVLLDDRDRRAVYLSEGLGHGFCSLEDGSTVVYLCSEGYNPSGEHEVHPLDPAIGIDWPLDGVEPELSAKDAAAPTLAEAAAAGLLPDYAACLAYRAGLA